MDQRVRDILALGRPGLETDRAVETIALGLQCADRLGDTRFDSCHLLHGLHCEPGGVAHHVLTGFDVTLQQIDDALASRDQLAAKTEFDIDDEMRLVLADAFEAADEMGHSYIGTEHLMIGVVASSTKSAKLLAELGFTRSVVRKEVRDILGHFGILDAIVGWIRKMRGRRTTP